jgi:hypothetical protein
MNSLDIIKFLLPIFALYAGYRWGFEVGHDRGNVEGRKKIKSFYESLKK